MSVRCHQVNPVRRLEEGGGESTIAATVTAWLGGDTYCCPIYDTMQGVVWHGRKHDLPVLFWARSRCP